MGLKTEKKLTKKDLNVTMEMVIKGKLLILNIGLQYYKGGEMTRASQHI